MQLILLKAYMTKMKIEVYAASPHASIGKALSILGIGRQALISVPTLPNRESVDTKTLNDILLQSQAKAKIFIASAGTVNSGDFDDISGACYFLFSMCIFPF